MKFDLMGLFVLNCTLFDDWHACFFTLCLCVISLMRLYFKTKIYFDMYHSITFIKINLDMIYLFFQIFNNFKKYNFFIIYFFFLHNLKYEFLSRRFKRCTRIHDALTDKSDLREFHANSLHEKESLSSNDEIYAKTSCHFFMSGYANILLSF